MSSQTQCDHGIYLDGICYSLEDEPDCPYCRMAEKDSEITKLKNDIRVMVEKAAAKHRPAYEEQQQRIADLEWCLKETSDELTQHSKALAELDNEVRVLKETLERCRLVCDATADGWRTDAERLAKLEELALAVVVEREHLSTAISGPVSMAELDRRIKALKELINE